MSTSKAMFMVLDRSEWENLKKTRPLTIQAAESIAMDVLNLMAAEKQTFEEAAKTVLVKGADRDAVMSLAGRWPYGDRLNKVYFDMFVADDESSEE